MKMTRIFRVLFLVLAAGFLAYAFWSGEQELAAGATLFWMLLWGLSLYTDQDAAPSIFFSVYAGACLIGSLMELRMTYLLAGFIASLSAWDLDRFLLRWRGHSMERAVEIRHLLFLLVADAVGSLLVLVGLSYRIQLSFAVMLVLGAAAVISLNWFIGLLRRASSKKEG